MRFLLRCTDPWTSREWNYLPKENVKLRTRRFNFSWIKSSWPSGMWYPPFPPPFKTIKNFWPFCGPSCSLGSFAVSVLTNFPCTSDLFHSAFWCSVLKMDVQIFLQIRYLPTVHHTEGFITFFTLIQLITFNTEVLRRHFLSVTSEPVSFVSFN